MNEATTKPKIVDGIFDARTRRDINQQVLWYASGKTSSEILELMKNPRWRSHLDEFRGHLFCSDCEQILNPKTCLECGQTPGTLHTKLDFIPVVHARCDWSILGDVVGILLANEVSAKVTFSALKKLNAKHVKLPFSDDELGRIFSDAGSIELTRRHGA